MVVRRKQGARAPRQTGSYLHVCPGGWKGVWVLVLVLVMEGEVLEWRMKWEGIGIKSYRQCPSFSPKNIGCPGRKGLIFCVQG